MKSGKKLAIIVTVITAIFIICMADLFAAKVSETRKTIIATAMSRNIARTVTAEGLVEPLKKQVIKPASDQKVIDVFVTEGQSVKKGAPLVKLDQSGEEYEMKVTGINLDMSRQDLQKLLSSESSGKKEMENALKQKTLELEKSKADYEKSLQKFQQDTELLQSGAISQEDYDASNSAVMEMKNHLKIMELQLENSQNALTTYDKDREDQIDKLRSNIALLESKMIYQQDHLDSNTNALIDGIVARMSLEKGQYPDSDAQLVLQDTSKYIVKVKLRQQDAIYLKEGNLSKIKLKGLDGKIYTGTVEDISDAGADGKMEIKVSFNEPDSQVKTGYDAEVSFDLQFKDKAVVVNFESIIVDPDGSKFIYYVENNIAKKRPVRTGIESGVYIEIIEGIIAGDQYVVNPPEKMQRKESMKVWGWGYEFR